MRFLMRFQDAHGGARRRRRHERDVVEAARGRRRHLGVAGRRGQVPRPGAVRGCACLRRRRQAPMLAGFYGSRDVVEATFETEGSWRFLFFRFFFRWPLFSCSGSCSSSGGHFFLFLFSWAIVLQGGRTDEQGEDGTDELGSCSSGGASAARFRGCEGGRGAARACGRARSRRGRW